MLTSKTGIALIAEKVQKSTGIKNLKECSKLVKVVCEALAETLEETGEAKVKGYFTLRLKRVASRTYTLPQNRGKVDKPEHTVVKFSPHTNFINRFNKDI